MSIAIAILAAAVVMSLALIARDTILTVHASSEAVRKLREELLGRDAVHVAAYKVAHEDNEALRAELDAMRADIHQLKTRENMTALSGGRRAL